MWKFLFGDNDDNSGGSGVNEMARRKKDASIKARKISAAPTTLAVDITTITTTTNHNSLTAMENGAITHVPPTPHASDTALKSLDDVEVELQSLDTIYFDRSENDTTNIGVGDDESGSSDKRSSDTIMSIQDVAANLEFEKQLERAISHSNHILTPREQQQTFLMLFQLNNAFDWLYPLGQLEEFVIPRISYREEHSSFNNVIPFMQCRETTTQGPIHYTRDLASSLYTAIGGGCGDDSDTHLLIHLDSIYDAAQINEIFIVSCNIISFKINLAIPVQLRYLSDAERHQTTLSVATPTASTIIAAQIPTPPPPPVQQHDWTTFIPFTPPQGTIDAADLISPLSSSSSRTAVVHIPHIDSVFHFETLSRDILDEPLQLAANNGDNQKYFLRKNKLWAIYVVEYDSMKIQALQTAIIADDGSGYGTRNRDCLIQRNLVSIIILKTIAEGARDPSVRLAISAVLRKASVLAYRMSLVLWREILKYVEFNCIRSRSPGIDIILRPFNGDRWPREHNDVTPRINATVGVDIKFRVFYKDKK